MTFFPYYFVQSSVIFYSFDHRSDIINHHAPFSPIKCTTRNPRTSHEISSERNQRSARKRNTIPTHSARALATHCITATRINRIIKIARTGAAYCSSDRIPIYRRALAQSMTSDIRARLVCAPPPPRAMTPRVSFPTHARLAAARRRAETDYRRAARAPDSISRPIPLCLLYRVVRERRSEVVCCGGGVLGR